MIVQSPPPFDPGIPTTFYKDIGYGPFNAQILDIWLPTTLEEGTPVVIGFHGGGFISGDKDMFYSGDLQNEVQHYLSNGLAFVSINYRLIGTQSDTEGVRKCYADAELGLRYVIQNAQSLNIDIDNIGMVGSSAGAAICQQLAYSNQISGIKGIGLVEMQSTYNFFKWEIIFAVYSFNVVGFSRKYNTWESLFAFLAFRSLEAIGSVDVRNYMTEIDTLARLGDFTGKIWLSSTIQPNTNPTDVNHLYHHPLHAKAIRDEAMAQSVSVVANIPMLNIFNSVQRQDFISDLLTV